MPGMGGFNDSINFQLNCAAWNELSTDYDGPLARIRLAPITGAVENIGYGDEIQYYRDMISACHNAGVLLSIGDGCPDIKLQAGIQAVKDLQGPKAAVFIKPYPDDVFLERMSWASDIAEAIGIDIDSYNIVTMRNLVHLERKTASALKALKKAAGVPFIMKGVFTRQDLELAREVHPDVIVVSNHGGRVENRIGSTARFLQEHAAELKNCCGELWVDGGIRTRQDIQTASSFGVSQVLVGRPFITALCRSGAAGVARVAANLK
ncbi:MAG: alpha-hydroxy-acid oxidizing protein [Treponemataceae bacterium]|nr:alpha-hydroxy-acid oxidizing protein [Treponemataceae bacterium]